MQPLLRRTKPRDEVEGAHSLRDVTEESLTPDSDAQ